MKLLNQRQRGAVFTTVILAALTGGYKVALAPPPPPSTPIVITEIRFLNFGTCDIVGGVQYVVDAADSPGVGACSGAASARFEVTGEPGAKVTIAIPNSVSITNGTDSLTTKFSQSPTGGNISFDGAGGLIIYVGGNFRIPQAGLATSGVFTVSTTLTVDYK